MVIRLCFGGRGRGGRMEHGSTACVAVAGVASAAVCVAGEARVAAARDRAWEGVGSSSLLASGVGSEVSSSFTCARSRSHNNTTNFVTLSIGAGCAKICPPDRSRQRWAPKEAEWRPPFWT